MGQDGRVQEPSRSAEGDDHGDAAEFAFFLGRCRTAAGVAAAGVRAGQPAGRGAGRGAGVAAGPGPGRVPGVGDVARAGGGDGVRSRVVGVAAARAGAQPGAARRVRLRPAGPAVGAEADAEVARGRRGGAGAGGAAASRRGSDGVGVLAVPVERGGAGGGDGRGVGDGGRAARTAAGGIARVRSPPGLRRQGGAELLDGPAERGDGEGVGSGRGLGRPRDVGRGPEREGLDEGEALVRLRAAPDRGRGARVAGVVRGGAGVALGAEGAVGGGGRAVSGRSRSWRGGARTSARTGAWTRVR